MATVNGRYEFRSRRKPGIGAADRYGSTTASRRATGSVFMITDLEGHVAGPSDHVHRNTHVVRNNSAFIRKFLVKRTKNIEKRLGLSHG